MFLGERNLDYFKHFTNAHENKSLMILLDEFGHFGYAAWFILLEMCIEKMEKNRGECYTEVHCSFTFHQRLVRQKLRISLSKVELFLDKCSTLDLLSYEFDGNEFHLYIPKILESLDRDQKRARQVRDQAARIAALDNKTIRQPDSQTARQLDKKTARQVPESVQKDTSDLEKTLGSKIFDSYSQAYQKRYGKLPIRDKTANTQLKKIGERLGQDGVEVAEFYVTHNRQFYVLKSHPVGLLLSDAEGLHTEWFNGKQTTSTEARSAENKQQVVNAFAKFLKPDEESA